METCAECGKPISPNEASYFTADPWGKGGPGKHHHSACGDPLGIKAAVVAERERCREAVLMTLREIGAAPGSSIASALAVVLRRIERKN